MPEIIKDHNDNRIQKFLGLKGINVDTFVIAEGYKVVEKMNKSLNIEEILTSKEAYEKNPDYFKQFKCNIYLSPESFIKEHVGYKFHQGVFAWAKHPGFKSIENIKGKTLLIDGLDNAENVGALIRSATGLGFKNIVFDSKSASPFLKRGIRVSMGNVFFANLYLVDDLSRGIKDLKAKGFEIYSAANESGAVSYRDIVPKSDFGVVIGNEGNGISDDVKTASTGIIKIPVNENVEHLNAAAAGAILMSRFSSY